MTKNFLLLCFSLVHCSQESGPEYIRILDEIPEHIVEVENITVYPGDSQPLYSMELIPEQTLKEIRFVREASFGDTDEVYLGSISDVAVDSLNRVFIADDTQHTIHVYHPDGSYLTSIGREGRGPGEFARVSDLRILFNKLYAGNRYSTFLLEVHIFSLKDLSYTHTVPLLADNRRDFVELEEGYVPGRFFPRKDEKFLVAYDRGAFHADQDERYVHYFLQNESGRIVSDQLMVHEDQSYLTHAVHQNLTIARSFPFYGHRLVVSDDEGRLYTASTENFKVQRHNMDGKVRQEIVHPFDHREFRLDEVIENTDQHGRTILQNTPSSVLPEVWPALDDLLVDDEHRIWVSTIIDDDKEREWWVLEESGEQLARFRWPVDEPIEVVRNEMVYTRQTDPETGLQQIVRYGIEWTEIQE